MKKTMLILLAGLALGAQSAYAGDANQSMSFWEKLRAKIESFAPQKKSNVTTATGGVRGAQVDSDDVYWKGEASPKSIAADELESFIKAVNLAETNDTSQAQSAFSDFIKQYPDSALRKDADQALAQLQSGNKAR